MIMYKHSEPLAALFYQVPASLVGDHEIFKTATGPQTFQK